MALKHTAPTINQNYTVQSTDCFVDFTKFTTAATCYLPSAVGVEGKILIIKSLNGSSAPVVPPPTGGTGSTVSAVTGTFTSSGIGSNSIVPDPVTGLITGMVAAVTGGSISVTDPITGTVFIGVIPPAALFTGPAIAAPNPIPSSFNGTLTGIVSGIANDPLTGIMTGVFSGSGTGSFTDPANGIGNYTSTVTSSVTSVVAGTAPVISTISINAFGSETINAMVGKVTLNSTFPLPSGSSITLISDGAGWIKIGL